MSKIKKGDRVRVYGAFNELKEEAKGKVLKVRKDGMLWVETDYDIHNPVLGGWRAWVHPKQCRKLVRVKK